LFPKGLFQISHLALLFTVPVLYTVLRLNSETQDHIPRLLGNILLVFASAWGSYIVVMTVRHGDKDNVIKNLLSEYRRQLGRPVFLSLSTLTLLFAATFLAHQLVFFRQVDFSSTTDVRLVLSDIPGRPENLGLIKAAQPIAFRLHIGTRYLACIDSKTERVFALDPINVPPWWAKKELSTINIKVEEKRYETLDDQTSP
jgi:hypothetical protein